MIACGAMFVRDCRPSLACYSWHTISEVQAMNASDCCGKDCPCCAKEKDKGK